MLYSINDSIRCYLVPSISDSRHGPAGDPLLYSPGKSLLAEAKILNINIIMKMGFVDCVPRTIIFLTRRSVQDLTICTLFPTHRMSKDNVVVKQWVACLARRFCRARRMSGEAAKFAREELENERHFSSCSRPNLLAVSLPSPIYYFIARPTKTAMLRRLSNGRKKQ